MTGAGGGGISDQGHGNAPIEYQVRVSTITSIDDTAKREALRHLINQIANAVDTSASHIRLTVDVTVKDAAKDALRQAADNAGTSVSITEI